MNKVKPTREQSQFWKGKFKSINIPFYNNGNFKGTISDIKKSRNIGTLSSFIKFLRELENLYTNDKTYKTISDIISSQINGIQNYYKHLVQSIESNNIGNLESYTNQIVAHFNNHSFISPDSLVYKQIKTQTLHNENQIIGYFVYFRTTQPSGEDQLFGYGLAFKVNDSSPVMSAQISLGNAVEEIGDSKQQLEEAKEKLLDEISEQKKIVKSTVENFNDEFSKIKDGMISYRNRLMLSGPLGIWYKRLSEYTGNTYSVSEEESRYEYDVVRQKWWQLNGKIKIYGFLSILWSVIGIFLAGGIFWWIFHQIPDAITDHTKTTIIMSVVASFVMFIYGYILRIFIKNWNTSRHICEEIEERISLTQFYIALSQNEQFTHQEIALQEIFKRIETGMIKEVPPKMSISSLINK